MSSVSIVSIVSSHQHHWTPTGFRMVSTQGWNIFGLKDIYDTPQRQRFHSPCDFQCWSLGLMPAGRGDYSWAGVMLVLLYSSESGLLSQGDRCRQDQTWDGTKQDFKSIRKLVN